MKPCYTSIWSSSLAFFVSQSHFATIVSAASTRFTYYPMLTAASFPCDVTYAADGNVWVEELLANKLASINPDTGVVHEYPIPFTVPVNNDTSVRLPNGDPAVSCAFANGFDGHLFASNGLRNQLVRMNLTTKKIDLFTPPLSILGNLQPLNDMTAAPDGIYFTQTTANVITKFDYETHEFTSFDVPTPASDPLGIYYATDGGIWFLELTSNKVGRFDRGAKVFHEYSLPASLAGPIVMRAEIQNRFLYFASGAGNSIGSIDMESKAIRAYPIPTNFSTPVEVCPSDAGDVWFTHIAMNALGRLRPSTGKVNEVTLPGTLNPGGPVSAPNYVGSGIYCKPGNAIWFTEGTKNRAGRYQLL